MVRLSDIDIEADYIWTGTDGYGGRLDEPQVVTAIGMRPEGWPLPVKIETANFRWYDVSPSTLSRKETVA